MEKTFNKIVLSKTEPNVEDLWMRINIEKLPDGKAIHGHSLWWFSYQGWKKLFDFDTRYNVTTDYDYSASSETYKSDSTYNPRVGIVDVQNTYYLYNASRQLGNNANLVVEQGLKYHVDYLQKQIDDLNKRLTKAEQDIVNINSELTKINSSLSSITTILGGINTSISNLESRISNLENNA